VYDVARWTLLAAPHGWSSRSRRARRYSVLEVVGYWDLVTEKSGKTQTRVATLELQNFAMKGPNWQGQQGGREVV